MVRETSPGHIHTVNDHNNVCHASTSSEEITKIKQVFFLTLKDEMWNLSAFAKKRLLELSAFAIKQTFNM